MKVVAVSDMHGLLPDPNDVPECDLLLIAGDVCPVRDHGLDRQERWLEETFNPWLNTLPARQIVGIAGNHDFIFQAYPRLGDDLHWVFLLDETVEFDGLVIHGSPWVPTFGPWAFMRDDEFLVPNWALIPDNVNILVTHGPAEGLGGLTARHVDAGSKTLRARIEELNDLRLHVFGHIHEAYGDYERGNTIHANVSMVDLWYKPRPFALREYTV